MKISGKHYVRFIFLRNDGAAAVEAAISFCIFVLLCALLIDYSRVVLEKSYISGVNTTLSSLLRERKALYGGRMEVDQNDIKQLEDISATILGSNFVLNKDYFIDVQAVYFRPSASKNNKLIDTTKTMAFHSASSPCDMNIPPANSAILTNLSTFEANKGWLPVYQVSICLPGAESVFKRVMGALNESMPDILIKNAVIPRSG